MRNRLLAVLGVVAIAAATTQFAAAGERKHVRKPARAATATTEQLRNANAWTVPQTQPEAYPYARGWSAPAGH